MPFVADRTTAPAAAETATAARPAARRRRRAVPADPRTAAALQRALDRRDNGAQVAD